MLNLKNINEKLDLLLRAPRIVELVGHEDRPKCETGWALSVDGIRE